MSSFLGNLRLAVRSWRRRPTLTLVALATLTLGIGANTAIFTVIKAVLLNRLPYPDPDLLMVVWERDPKGIDMQVSNPNFVDFRTGVASFEQMAAYRHVRYAFKGSEDAMDVAGVRATVDMFSVLGVRPALGYGFTAEHGVPGGDHVAVLSDGFWRSQFGTDPGVIGRTIELDAQPYEIIGVMPAGFGFPPGQSVSIWTPLTFNNADAHDTSRASRGLNVIGRLAGGATLAQAEQELAAAADRLARAYPATNKGWSARLVPAREQLVQSVRPALLVVFAGVVFLLIIVCVNVANLMLARLATRRREMAVRRSVGAEGRHLVGLVLTESAVLSLAGGAFGLLAAWGCLRLLATLPTDSLPRLGDVHLDWGVLGFTLSVSVLAACVFGTLPAFVSARADLRDELHGTGGPTHSLVSRRLLNALVVAEVAIALVLLVGAGLLTRSFARLLEVRPGFSTDGIAVAQVYLPRTKYRQGHDQARFFDTLLGRLRTTPGVVGAGATSALPLHPVGLDFALPFTIDNHVPPADEIEPRADIRIVTPGYVETLRIPLIRGRLFDERDGSEAPHVMLINASLARRYFGAEDPIGAVVTNPHGRAEVIGVVGDVHHYGLDSNPRPEIYLPYDQNRLYAMAIVLRATDPSVAGPLIRSTVAGLDPGQPIRDLTTLEHVLARSVFLPRFSMLLVGAFATAALILAAVGIYGVLSYSVAQQTRDIGVRMALGAQAGDALRQVLGHSLILAMIGSALGALLVIPSARLMRGALYAVDPLDPLVLGGVVATLGVVALAAALVPGLRATRIDPITALRSD